MIFNKKKPLLLAIAFTATVACSPMDIISGALGSKGVEATAQVGESNNKGTLAVQSGAESNVGDVKGDAKVVTNSSLGMASMALIGMIPFVLLAFYLLPAPKWIQRRYNASNEKAKDEP